MGFADSTLRLVRCLRYAGDQTNTNTTQSSALVPDPFCTLQVTIALPSCMTAMPFVYCPGTVCMWDFVQSERGACLMRFAQGILSVMQHGAESRPT